MTTQKRSEAYLTLCSNSTTLLTNISKSHLRGFSEHVKVLHANTLVDLLNQYIVSVVLEDDGELHAGEWQKIVTHFGKAFEQLTVDIDLPQEFPGVPIQKLGSARVEANMANFDFSTGLRLDELTSTKAVDIESFIDVASCYHDTLSEAGQLSLVKFLVAAKIKKEAKTRFGITVPTTLEELKKTLRTKVLAAETEDELLAKLHNARQGKRNLQDFARYLGDLASRLAAAMVKKMENPTVSQSDTVKQTCQKLALVQFKTTCHEEVKVVLAAARPNSLDEALEVATASNLDTQTFNLNYMRTGKFNRNGQQHFNSRSNDRYSGDGKNTYNANNYNKFGGRKRGGNNYRGGHRNFNSQGQQNFSNQQNTGQQNYQQNSRQNFQQNSQQNSHQSGQQQNQQSGQQHTKSRNFNYLDEEKKKN